MWQMLNKLFVRSYYRANTGFFLFFFFVFFGAVEGSSLLPYHLSLMKSMLHSTAITLLVCFCWLLYHIKCTVFFLRVVNSPEGAFLLNLQTLGNRRQWRILTTLYVAVYAPVFLYGVVVFCVGLQTGFMRNATIILLFQVVSLICFTAILHYRLNHWLEKSSLPALRLPFRKSSPFFVLFYFTNERKNLLLGLKAFSLGLLYLVLVWNRGRYDNDSFLLFYLVLLLAHAAVPYFAVQFLERDFALLRNMPLSLPARAAVFLVPYLFLLLPETAYIFYAAGAFDVNQKLAYCINFLASLSLLTAILYSEAQSRDEYLKATFALLFISLFMLHAQAFWFWIAAQFIIAAILFASGYYKFERKEA